MLRLNITQRIKKTLKDGSGYKTGLVAADFDGSNIYICKADGTTSIFPLTLGVNFFEVSATDFPGLYEFVLTTIEIDQLGPLVISFKPAAVAFLQDYTEEYVEEFEEKVDLIKTDTSTVTAVLPGTTIASAVNVTASTTSIKGVDNRDITTIAGAGFAPSDSLVSIKAAITSSAGDVWDELLASHVVPNSYGEFMSLLYAVILNRVKIDTTLKTLKVYAADDTTVLRTYQLFDPNGFPSGVNVTERLRGT